MLSNPVKPFELKAPETLKMNIVNFETLYQKSCDIFTRCHHLNLSKFSAEDFK